jgi:hypothetical protein
MMRADILGFLIVMLATALYIAYGIRSARQGKEPSVILTLALGLSMKWLFLIEFPVIIAVIFLMGKFAPGVLAAVPMRVIPDTIFPAVGLTVAATFLSLWRRGVR